MKKLNYVLAATLLAGQVHAQLLHLGGAANVNAGAGLGATVQGATRAVGTAAGALGQSAANASVGIRDEVVAPAAAVSARSDAQVRTNVDAGADAGMQVETPAQARATADARSRARPAASLEAQGRGTVRTQAGAVARGATAAGVHARGQLDSATSVETPGIQAGTGVDARLSGTVQGR